MIKEYFHRYVLARSDVTFDLHANSIVMHRNGVENWRVTCVDTGENTMTGGRLKRVRQYLGEETFCVTYGDGVTDLDIGEVIRFHRDSGALVTVTAVRQPGRFGALALATGEDRVLGFREKSNDDGGFINGGFFVMEPAALDYIDGDDTTLEREPLEALADEGRLVAYRHRGYWQNMDTLRDKMLLEDLWKNGNAPWKTW
jgi:glucose-1-phosphate cytidylyltransferase